MKSDEPTKNAWRSPRAGAAAIILLAIVAYLPALRGGFVFDDPSLIINNRLVQAGDGLYRFWLTTDAADYYPLTSSLWWLEWRLWGTTAAGYHVVNVLLHVAACVLVWLVLRRLKIPGAWLAALVFALHPVNVATVAWISEQKNTLSMLFYLIAILLYLRFDEENRWRCYGWSLVAFLLALFSKTAVVMLPVVLLGCVWWRRGRIQRRDLLCSAPFFAVALVLGLATIWFQHHGAMVGQAVRVASFAERLAGAGWVLWFYLGKALLPFDLCMNYPQWKIDPSQWISYAPDIALIVCLLVFWWKRQTWGRPLLFALGYFTVTLFPVLGFFDQGFYRYSLVADHWQYIAIVAPIALVVAAVTALWRQRSHQNPAMAALAGGALVLALGTATWRRSGVFETEETLWRDTLAKNPRSWLAHNYVGTALMQAGKLDEAFRNFEQALQIKPDYAPAYYNEGVILWQVGKAQEAVAHWEEAVRLRPDYYPAYNNLGFALLQEGRAPEAIEPLEHAARINPDIAETRYNLGRAFAVVGKLREAIEQYDQALRIKPDYIEVCNNLAWLLTKVPTAEGGDPVRAVTLAERACDLTNYSVPPYLDTLAAAYAANGQFNQAVVAAERAIELARSAGQTQLVSEIEGRLELYRNGRALPSPPP